MWRCVSRLVRDAFQRSAPGAPPSPAAAPGGVCGVPGGRQRSQPSVANADTDRADDDHRRSRIHLCDTWLNAVSWSGAVVLGWYASQLTCLRRRWERSYNRSIFYNDFDRVPAGQALRKLDLSSLRDIVCTPPLVNVSNDIPSTSSTDAAEKEFKEVLRSIENKLGIIAIDDGKFEEGLDMLQSSAQKNYAPALYNLAICYEKGLGVKKDEKMAMELYRSAAVKNHPSAMYNLAIFYGQGRGGLTRDTATANEMLRVAAAQGQKDAISALKLFKEQNQTVLETEIPPVKLSPTDTFLNIIGCEQKVSYNFNGNDTILSF